MGTLEWERAGMPWDWHHQQAQEGCQLPAPSPHLGRVSPGLTFPGTWGWQSQGPEPWGAMGTVKPSDICLPTSRRTWQWSRALLRQSCGLWCGNVLLWCFVRAATGRRWRETPQGQVTPQQSQTGTSSPLKVGAAGQQGFCPGSCFTSCPQTCPCLSPSTSDP